MSFPARFRSTCECGNAIAVGDLIERIVGGLPDETLGYKHVSCPDDPDLSAGTPCPSCWLVHAGECW